MRWIMSSGSAKWSSCSISGGCLIDGHHEQSHRVAGLHRRQAANPADTAVGLRREPLEVRHGDRTATGAQRLRSAPLDVLDGFGVDATACGQQVLHSRDVRQRRSAAT